MVQRPPPTVFDREGPASSASGYMDDAARLNLGGPDVKED